MNKRKYVAFFKRHSVTIAVLAIGIFMAVFLSNQFGQKSPTSVPTEVIEVPADEAPSNGGLVSQDELKAAGDKLVAGAKDFGRDCNAAETYTLTTGGDARCKMEGAGGEVIYSIKGLPEDPAEQSAEKPIAR